MERRNTRQRQIILEAVTGRLDHPTVEQIYEDVKKVDESISLATVYRNLSILAEENKITNIRLKEGNHYDLRTDKHNHFMCENCGKVFDVPVKYDEKIDDVEIDGFKVIKHQTTFIGLCPKCASLKKR